MQSQVVKMVLKGMLVLSLLLVCRHTGNCSGSNSFQLVCDISLEWQDFSSSKLTKTRTVKTTTIFIDIENGKSGAGSFEW